MGRKIPDCGKCGRIAMACKKKTLQAALAHVATLSTLKDPQIKQLRNAVTATSSLRGVYSPAGFAKAAEELNMLWTHVDCPQR